MAKDKSKHSHQHSYSSDDGPPEQAPEVTEEAITSALVEDKPLDAREAFIRSVLSVRADSVPAPQWYRVVRAGTWTSDGVLHQLPAGTCVCETTHDLASLRVFGIELERCEPPRRPVDAYGEPV